MLGAQAALQEYDGIWRFAWSHRAQGLLKPRPIHYFNVSNDPLQRATERAVTMLYLRGDMKPLARRHAIVFPEKALRHDFSCGPQADIADMWFGWHAPRRGGGRAEGREGFVRREYRPRPGRGDLLLRNRPLRKGMRPLRTYPVLI